MRFVAAPNPLKGSLTAPAAAAAIARGIRSVFPDAEVEEVPIADGGEGTVEALVAAGHGRTLSAKVEGPLGDAVDAAFGLIDGGATAVVELAAASGLTLVHPQQLDPRRASTYGFGRLLEAARARGVRRVIAAVGGSATNDGGAGMAQALGYRLLDAAGQDLPRGGAALLALDRIDGSAVSPAWREIEVTVATDVTNPLCGPEGASAIYGPQKGAGPEVVAELDRALAHLAEVIERDLGVEVLTVPGAGAAGGAGAGLMAFLGARLERGAPLVVSAAGFDRAVQGADAVFTAEGRVDGQTASGKGPAEVARRAAAAGVPVVLLAGGIGPGWETIMQNGVSAVEPMSLGPSSLEDMLHDADRLLSAAAARACRLMSIWKR